MDFCCYLYLSSRHSWNDSWYWFEMKVWVDYETCVFCPFQIRFMVWGGKLFFVESDFIIKVNIPTLYTS